MPEGAGTGLWATFARDLRAGPAGLARASRRAFHLALLALSVPGLPLGALYLLSGPAPYPAAAWGFAALGLGLGLLALRLARQAARDMQGGPPGRAALTAAMQAASAPAIPFLLGCAALHQPLAWGLCWAAAAALYGLARMQLPTYARAAGGDRGP